MNKEHKIYTEEEVKSYFKDNGAIKYTIINPFSGYEENFYHDCGIASISVYDDVVSCRYQSGIGMVDHSFPLKSIVNIENISYETLIFELSPSNM